jgi:hypothetical protein
MSHRIIREHHVKYAQRGHGYQRKDQRTPKRQSEPGGGHQTKVAAKHYNLTVCKVDRSQRIVDKNKAKTGKGIDTTHGQAANNFLNHFSFPGIYEELSSGLLPSELGPYGFQLAGVKLGEAGGFNCND